MLTNTRVIFIGSEGPLRDDNHFIKEEILGLPKKELYESIIRYGASGIILNNDGNVAVFHKTKKKEFKLPGGGLMNNESPEEAFIREIMEETGCSI